MTSTAYNLISGPQSGAILARNPEGYENKIELTKDDKYIIVTNFDWWNNDIREFFDQTAGEIGTPRRIVAQKYLDKHDKRTPEVLYEALNQKGAFDYN